MCGKLASSDLSLSVVVSVCLPATLQSSFQVQIQVDLQLPASRLYHVLCPDFNFIKSLLVKINNATMLDASTLLDLRSFHLFFILWVKKWFRRSILVGVVSSLCLCLCLFLVCLSFYDFDLVWRYFLAFLYFHSVFYLFLNIFYNLYYYTKTT